LRELVRGRLLLLDIVRVYSSPTVFGCHKQKIRATARTIDMTRAALTTNGHSPN
jgi:hypothetical protein